MKDETWNSVVFLFLGIIFGFIIFWGLASENLLVSAKAGRFINALFNDVFVSTFVAAISGAGVILFIEHRKDQRIALSEFNAARAILSVQIGLLINIKRDFALPLVQEIDRLIVQLSQAKAFGDAYPNIPNPYSDFRIERCLISYQEPEISYRISYDKIAKHAVRDSNALVLCMRAQDTLDSSIKLICEKNKFSEKIQKIPGLYDKLISITGLPMDGGITDGSFVDTSRNLLVQVNASLFFHQKAFDALGKLAKKTLAPRLSNKLNKMYFSDKEAEKLMPPSDLLSGWEI